MEFMLILALIIAWLLAPIVLGIVCICQRRDIKKLTEENNRLRGGMTRSAETSAPASTPAPVQPARYSPAPSAPVSPQTPVNKPVQTPPPMPAQYIPSPAPSYRNSAENNIPSASRSTSTINVILILGALFITLAGFVFSAAAWGTLNTLFKSVILISFSAVFFGISVFTERKLKLSSTSRVFFTLGAVFLPAAAAAAGLLKVFGEYFSFHGEGKLLVIALMTALLTVTCFIGTHKYKSRNFAKAAYTSLTCTAAALIIHAAGTPSTAALMLSLYSLAVLLLGFTVEKHSDNSIVAAEYRYFTTVNTWILAVISLFMSEGSSLFIVPAMLFSASFFISSLKDKNPAAGTCAFAAYLAVGACLSLTPEAPDELAFIIAAVMIIFTCISLMNTVPEQIRSVMEKLRSITAYAVMIFAFAGNIDSGFSLASLVAAAAVYIQMLVISLTERRSHAKAVCFFFFLQTAFEFSGLLYRNSEDASGAPLIFALIIGAYFAAVRLSPLKKHLYTCAADVVTVSALAISLFVCDADVLGTYGRAIIWTVLTASAFISGRSFAFGRIAAPFAVIFSSYAAYGLIDKTDMAGFAEEFALAAAVVIYCLTASVLTAAKPLRRYAAPFSIGAAVIPAMLLIFDNDHASLIIAAAVSVFAAVNFISNASHKSVQLFGSFMLASVSLTALTAGLIMCETLADALIFPAVVMLLLFGIAIMPMETGLFGKCSETFIWWAAPIYSTILFLVLTSECTAAIAFTAFIIMLIGCTAAIIRKNVWLMYPCLIIMFPCIDCYAGENAMPAVIAIMALCCAAGRIIFRSRTFSAENPSYSDFLTISSFSGVFCLLSQGSDYSEWAGLLMAGLICLCMLRKENNPKLNSGLLTAASIILLPVWWKQPFFELPDIIEAELMLLPVPAICFFLKLIHKEHTEAIDNISFAAAIISLMALFIDALDSEYAADAVILGAVIAMILIVSFILRQKRWFVLSVASAAAEALLLTISLWNSSIWWVYLLIAGIIFILIGMTNEINKQKGKEGQKLTRFMSDWKW